MFFSLIINNGRWSLKLFINKPLYISLFMLFVNMLYINEFVVCIIQVGFDITGCDPTLNII